MFKRLVPTGEAFKGLRWLWTALDNVAAAIKGTADSAFEDLDPYRTTRLGEWLAQFGLLPTGTRAQLAGAWRATGGQSAAYIQSVLQAQGFNVYVHTWYTATLPVGSTACATARNPLAYLGGTGNPGLVQAGEVLAQAGEAFAQAGQTATSGAGYLLVDNSRRSVDNYASQAGEPAMQAGEDLAQAGEGAGVTDVTVEYSPPADPSLWPFLVYVGGQTFPNLASVPSARRAEFENLLLKYCPAHLWIGVLVNYT